MPDPRLKDAMIAIKKILTTFDIGASIALVSKSHSEWLYHMPEWSCVKLQDDGGVRIKSHHADYPSKDAQKEHLEVSVHVIYQLRDLGVQTASNMQQLCELIERHLQVDHTPYSKD
jgi:hypothetical protein